jgi:two-component system nitrogen regulation response regulator GlnG
MPKHAVRVVAGTAVNLQVLVEQGLFREDLFFELSVAVLNVPPLRDRAEDIPQIAHSLCSRFSEELKAEKMLEEEAIAALQAHDWQGNIRELELILKRLCLTGQYARLSASMVAEEIGRTANIVGEALPVKETNLSDSFSQHIERYFAAAGEASPVPGLHARILAEIEKPLIMETLYHTAGNQIKAAHILGLNRNTLRKKIKELNIPSKRDLYRKRGQEGR